MQLNFLHFLSFIAIHGIPHAFAFFLIQIETRLRKCCRNFPASSVVKTPLSQCRGQFHPLLGNLRSLMLHGAARKKEEKNAISYKILH